MIYITSDPHYWHRNIAGPKVSSWKSGYRDFEDEAEMSRTLVKEINQIVKPDDVLYCLGDWSFGGIPNIWNFRKQLLVKQVHLALGNHDHHIKRNNEIAVPKEDRGLLEYLEIPDDPFKRFNGFSHIGSRNLFSSVEQVLQFETGSHKFFCSHYAHRVWEDSHKGVIHLYGHSHFSLEEIGKSTDVGVDAAYSRFGRYRPFSITEVIEMMDSRETTTFDHHGKAR